MQKRNNDMTEHTIHFDNSRETQDLAGYHRELIMRIEKTLGVKLVSRDTWLKIEGIAANVKTATHFFECLRRARNRGIVISEHGLLVALKAFEDGRIDELEDLYSCRIAVSSTKAPIFPQTFGQKNYVQAISNHDIAFGIGPAGTGKTYLAMAMAISSLLKQEVSRIILARPAIEAGESLGFLPGDLEQKVLPYLRPLYDALYDMMDADDIERNMSRGVIEVAPLAYMRGRTLNHAFVLLDEAQNCTPEQMMMFLTRLGFDSKCVITGDLTQIDLPAKRTSGLLEAKRLLKQIDGIAFTELDDSDVVRHALVQRIIQAYREGRENVINNPKG